MVDNIINFFVYGIFKSGLRNCRAFRFTLMSGNKNQVGIQWKQWMTDSVWSHKILFAEFSDNFLANPQVDVVEPVELENQSDIKSMIKKLSENFPAAIDAESVEAFTSVVCHLDPRYLPLNTGIGKIVDKILNGKNESANAIETNAKEDGQGVERGGNSTTLGVSQEIDRFKTSRPAQFGVDVEVNGLISYSSSVHENLRMFSRENYQKPAAEDFAVLRASEGEETPIFLCQVVEALSENTFIIHWYGNENNNIHGVFAALQCKTGKGKKAKNTDYVDKVELETFICWGFDWNKKTRKIPSHVLRYALKYMGLESEE